MKIYTKTGDKGQTSLANGKRVSKNDIKIEAYGTIDELNSFIGLLNASLSNTQTKEKLIQIQSMLFSIGSILASVKQEQSNDLLKNINSEFLEKEIDLMNNTIPELTSFILPGGNQSASYCHVIRSICRRAERNVVTLASETDIPETILIFLNRLSDYFFVLARKLTFDAGNNEIHWVSGIEK